MKTLLGKQVIICHSFMSSTPLKPLKVPLSLEVKSIQGLWPHCRNSRGTALWWLGNSFFSPGLSFFKPCHKLNRKITYESHLKDVHLWKGF